MNDGDDRLKIYLRRLTSELKATKEELRAEKNTRMEPVAIMACAGCASVLPSWVGR